MRHGVYEDAQIGSDGDVVGEVPGDDDKDGPAKETARTRTVCCDARRGTPMYGACGHAERLMKVAGAGRCRCRSRGAG
jgi:hypothetical protein